MFAMDSLIRRAVQAAVTILIPGKCPLVVKVSFRAVENARNILCTQQLSGAECL
jgi:hypothetical protein